MRKYVIALGFVALAVPLISFAFQDSTPNCVMSVSPQHIPINTVQDLTITIVNSGVTSTFTENQIQVVRYITQFHYTSGSASCFTYLLAH